MFERTIVVGASSGIGAALATRLAANGCQVAAVARRGEALAALTKGVAAAALHRESRGLGVNPRPRGNDEDASAGRKRLGVAAPGSIRPYVHDVHAFDEVPAMFQSICRDLGGLDAVIYAAGVMPRMTSTEYDLAKDADIVAVNLLGAVAWLNPAAERFAAARAGTIVGLSSVAGDRGRRGQPVYGASKAALAHYLEALRNRLRHRGVRVLTAKPGPVATPMTEGLDKLPFVIPAERAAQLILRAAAGTRQTVYVPERWRLLMAILRLVPSSIFSRLEL